MAPAQAWEALHSAELVCSAAAVSAAVQRVAADITRELATVNPLVLSVMGGAVVFTGQLLPQLRFPLEFDYLHLTRYASTMRGGTIEWKVFPRTTLSERVVLVVDDILDEGYTMAEIRDRVLAAGASRFHCAVFADKDIGKPKPITPDYIGVKLPNRYVFGYGMDVEGAWRNLPEIYAVKQD